MALNIAAEERQTVHYIGVPLSARFSEFGAPGGPNEAIPRIYQWLGEHQVAPLGGPLYVYRHIGDSDDTVDLTVSVPIAGPIKPTDGLVIGSLPAGTYVVGRHIGAPDAIPAVHSEVKNGPRPTGIASTSSKTTTVDCGPATLSTSSPIPQKSRTPPSGSPICCSRLFESAGPSIDWPPEEGHG